MFAQTVVSGQRRMNQVVQTRIGDKPVLPTMSETCDTVVPDAAPRYKTLLPGAM